MTHQGQKKLQVALGMLSAVAMSAMTMGVEPEAWHKGTVFFIFVLHMISTQMPAMFGDAPAERLVETTDPSKPATEPEPPVALVPPPEVKKP